MKTEIYDQLCAMLEEKFKELLRGSSPPEGLGALIEEQGAVLARWISKNGSSSQWLYLRIAAEAGSKHPIITVAPILEQMGKQWWWLNKTDACGYGVRLRVMGSSADLKKVRLALQSALKEAGWKFSELEYEPELCLFGGERGIEIAHEHFCADSRFLSAWMAKTISRGPVIPEGLSLALLLRLLGACGLDLFESWDVFARVYDKRQFFKAKHPEVERFRVLAGKVFGAGPQSVFALYKDERAALLEEYCAFLDDFGKRLGRCYFQGLLECGIREFLAPVIFFHWNRIGLAPFHQFALARAVVEELEQRSCRAAVVKAESRS